MSLKTGLEERIKGLALADVDIILVKERHLYERLKTLKVPGVKRQIQMVLVNNLDDMKALSHVDMRSLGWVREEKVRDHNASGKRTEPPTQD